MKKEKKEEMFNINSSPPGYLSMRDYLKKLAQNTPQDVPESKQEHKD